MPPKRATRFIRTEAQLLEELQKDLADPGTSDSEDNGWIMCSFLLLFKHASQPATRCGLKRMALAWLQSGVAQRF